MSDCDLPVEVGDDDFDDEPRVVASQQTDTPSGAASSSMAASAATDVTIENDKAKKDTPKKKPKKSGGGGGEGRGHTRGSAEHPTKESPAKKLQRLTNDFLDKGEDEILEEVAGHKVRVDIPAELWTSNGVAENDWPALAKKLDPDYTMSKPAEDGKESWQPFQQRRSKELKNTALGKVKIDALGGMTFKYGWFMKIAAMEYRMSGKPTPSKPSGPQAKSTKVTAILRSKIRSNLKKAVDAIAKQLKITSAAADKMARLRKVYDKLVEKATERNINVGDIAKGLGVE